MSPWSGRCSARSAITTSTCAVLWLARALANDTGAVSALSESLGTDATPLTRVYAATALGMIGGDAARRALLDRLPAETMPQVRVSIAQGLGLTGRGDDAPPALD